MQQIAKQTNLNGLIKIALGVGFFTGLFMALMVSLGAPNALGHSPNFLEYGEVGAEDELYFYHHGVLYINAVPSQGNGLFIAETDIDQDYSIDQAIERFGIYEDTEVFNVKPSQYSNVIVMYELDEDLQFQITHIYEDSESGLMDEVQQMENSQ
jgi:hypothetical protein